MSEMHRTKYRFIKLWRDFDNNKLGRWEDKWVQSKPYEGNLQSVRPSHCSQKAAIDGLPWLSTDFISDWGADIVDKYIYSATISGKTFLQTSAPWVSGRRKKQWGKSQRSWCCLALKRHEETMCCWHKLGRHLPQLWTRWLSSPGKRKTRVAGMFFLHKT